MAAILGAAWAMPAPLYAADTIPNPANTYLIHFEPGVSMAERDTAIATMGGQLLRWLPALQVASVLIELPITQRGRQSSLNQWAIAPHVLSVEADGLVEGVFFANDPDLLDTNKSYAPQLLNLAAAWDYTTGSTDVIIAVLDSGIAHAHAEFAGRILPGYDMVNDDDDPEDDYGHGTHVAGIAAAGLNNGIGMAGVCGFCSILPVKVLNRNNAGTWAGVAEGLIYAVGQGADIVVLSLGSKNSSKTIEDAVNYALDHNVLVIAAAGNANSADPFYPAALPGVLGVGASTKNDEKWSLSNYGDQVDVMAPGDSIYSTFNDFNNENGGYAVLSGTSMAAPHVAGLAGLLLSQDPTRTAADLQRLLQTTAKELGEPGGDALFGRGRIDPVAALQAATGLTATAMLSGTVWLDGGSQALGATVQQPLAGIQVDLYNEQLMLVKSVVSDNAGQWRLDGLPAATYTVRAIPLAGLIVTGAAEIQVVVESVTRRTDLNFSFAPIPALSRLYFPTILN